MIPANGWLISNYSVSIKNPTQISSLYYNYQCFFCVILPAFVYAQYRLLGVNICDYNCLLIINVHAFLHVLLAYPSVVSIYEEKPRYEKCYRKNRKNILFDFAHTWMYNNFILRLWSKLALYMGFEKSINIRIQILDSSTVIIILLCTRSDYEWINI